MLNKGTGASDRAYSADGFVQQGENRDSVVLPPKAADIAAEKQAEILAGPARLGIGRGSFKNNISMTRLGKRSILLASECL